MKTYTEDEMSAVLAQVADLESKLRELEGAKHENAASAKVAEMTAQFDAERNELNSKLDAAVLEAQTAKDEKTAILAYLEEIRVENERAAEVARLREERVVKVKEVASFTDEYIAERADAWAALSEDAFEATLADWKAISEKAAKAASAPKTEKSAKPESTIPAETAMASTSESTGSVLHEVISGFRAKGVDPRTI